MQLFLLFDELETTCSGDKGTVDVNAVLCDVDTSPPTCEMGSHLITKK